MSVHKARADELNEALGEMQWEANRTKGIMVNMGKEREELHAKLKRATELLSRVENEVGESSKYQIQRFLKGDYE